MGRRCWMLMELKTPHLSYPTKLVILGVKGTAVVIWGTPAAEAVPSGFGTKGGFAKMILWHRTIKNYNVTTANKPRYPQQQREVQEQPVNTHPGKRPMEPPEPPGTTPKPSSKSLQPQNHQTRITRTSGTTPEPPRTSRNQPRARPLENNICPSLEHGHWRHGCPGLEGLSLQLLGIKDTALQEGASLVEAIQRSIEAAEADGSGVHIQEGGLA